MAPTKSNLDKLKDAKDDAINAAVDHCKRGLGSERSAVKLFDVNRGTLRARLADGREGLQKRGPEVLLTDAYESNLVEWIIKLNADRRPPTRADIVKEAQKWINWNEIPIPNVADPWARWSPGSRFFDRLFDRHPELSKKVPQIFNDKRHLQECVPVVDDYFQKLLEVLYGEHKFIDKPWNIYGTDETMQRMKDKQGTVIGVTGTHCASRERSAYDQGHVTLLPFVRAAAHPDVPNDTQWMPPLVIVADPGMHKMADGTWSPWSASYNAITGAPEGTAWTRTKKGSVTLEIFIADILPFFVQHLPPRADDEWVLLLLDGAAVHGLENIKVIEFCRANRIHLFAYPPDLTHILQGLDKAAFKS